MPTTLKRTSITHTPPIERALALARKRHPETDDRALMVQMIEDSAARLAEEQQRWEEIVDNNSRRLAESFGPIPDNYLEELRAEWPE
ncbi:MAG: hypothetical protein FWD83_01820 [Promicromonosporaceae bacterium]|nr:hypothetical protein [Promicromonosporaceae bacterium]